KFTLTTVEDSIVTLAVSCIGYTTYSVTGEAVSMDNLEIFLKPQTNDLDEVVVYAGNYLLKSPSTISKTKVVDMLSTAGSNGDMIKAISMLPGTQAPDRDGRLLVRGGSSRESQTYIDDMHVLSPYSASFGEVGSRSRYSPVLFEGINFSLGGYVPEYSQGLSAVLPLYTRDEVNESKSGVDVMNVSLGSSGAIPWHNGSASYNMVYTDLTLYNELFFPSLKSKWQSPYKQIGLQNQFRFTLGKDTYLKSYLGYSKTGFVLISGDPFSSKSRNLELSDDNLYVNTTLRKRFDNGAAYFLGVAYSSNQQNIENGRTIHDTYSAKEREIHLKSKAEKRFNDFYKITAGVETFFKRYEFHYADTVAFDIGFNHCIGGAFVSNDFGLTKNLLLNLSARMEYTSLSKEWQWLPRIALGYKWRDMVFSGVLGKYQQNADNEALIYNRNLLPENNIQALIGVYYEKGSRIFRFEAYHKDYDHLPLKSGVAFPYYNSDGSGYSKGFDLFFNDTQFLKYWEYMLAYSYNDSRRKYLDFPYMAAPPFAMRHNASATLKYSNFSIRSIFSVSNRFASGRHYHDPNREGFMNSRTPNYNSLDISWIYLANKRTIVYFGFSNILNRQNIYGYVFNDEMTANNAYESHPLTQQINQAFYIGCFISLGKNAAYNVSNFY
ncbi:MAG: TonB-dependent receptor, partial [Proteiniphilum sp.]|nr:TonB-dependent receptor [Proteiniphilum sp.]